MNPIYFGEGSRQLYGVYDEAAAEAPARGVAVVLAYPAFPEYNKAHWVFRSLAQRCAQAGFFTLRFDYYATGDSSGRCEAGSLAQWTADIETAAAEARDLSGAREIALVGMNLGATLAARAVEAGLRVRDLVLWDPVVSGDSYMRHLRARDRIQRRVRLLSRARPRNQLLGYPFPDHMRREMENIDLHDVRVDGAQHVQIVSTRDGEPYDGLLSRLTGQGTSARFTRVEREQVSAAAGRESARLSSKPIDCIVQTLLQAEAS